MKVEHEQDAGPDAREAMTNLRDGLERAHEIVAEVKLAMRQIGEEPPPTGA